MSNALAPETLSPICRPPGMMREGKHGDFVLLRKEDDVVWEPAQNESLNPGLPSPPSMRVRAKWFRRKKYAVAF